MSSDQMTKEQARVILENYLVRQAKKQAAFLEITAGYPDGYYSFSDNGKNREDYYSVYVGGDTNCIGSGRYIIISKITGKVVGDNSFGE